MNAKFKPLGLAAAVASLTAGYAGLANAQASLAGNTQLGDLGIVPYYTVQAGYATGLHIVNTADRTQVVKVRFRRAPDSMDALDFNVILSPEDVYTGFLIEDESDDKIKFVSADTTCTAPNYVDRNGNPTSYEGIPAFEMPDSGTPNYRETAESGYIEVISMGSPVSETSHIAVNALHDPVTGAPENCAAVRDHFFAGGVAGASRGVQDSVTTFGGAASGFAQVDYEASPDSLKVSYFIKSDVTGTEFGNNAVHIAGFMDGASMTNQQAGVFQGDLQGFDHPDLNGGAPQSVLDGVAGAASLGLYNDIRVALGSTTVINEWSKASNDLFTVGTDWVMTYPGQYVMLDYPAYQNFLLDETLGCVRGVCDFRDIPMTALFNTYNREELGITQEEGDLVVSPAPPSFIDPQSLAQEVNLVQWGALSVLDPTGEISTVKPDTPPVGAAGWAALTAVTANPGTQAICEYDGSTVTVNGNPFPGMNCGNPAIGSAPVVGFAAWERSFLSNSAANYGRIIEHSRIQSTP